MIDTTDNSLTPVKKQAFVMLIALGVLGLTYGLAYETARTWIMILVSNFFIFSIGVFGTFFLAISYTISSSHTVPYRKVVEAIAATTPITGLLMLTILFGVHDLYEWSHPSVMAHDALLQKKSAYLNMPFFAIRSVFGVAIMAGISMLLVNMSRKQDEEPHSSVQIEEKLRKTSSVSLVFLTLTLCVLSFDWLMSIEPHWYSTIYGLLVWSGFMAYGLSFTILAIIYLQDKTLLGRFVNENHLHDLGKWLFAVSTFWAYIWYCQYLLIWYANIPEAASHYHLRFEFGWGTIMWISLILAWLVPFLSLLPRAAKRSKFVLVRVSWIVIIGQLCSLYVMVAPQIFKDHKIYTPTFSWFEAFIIIGYVGVFLYTFTVNLYKAPLLAKNSPYFEEGVNMHQ